MDVARLVARATRRFSTRTALDGPQGRQTFAELGDRVARLANGLRGLGLSPGDRVLDLQTNQNTYVETDLALACAGLVRVALNHRLHPRDWEHIAQDCGATALIYDAQFTEPSESLRGGLPGRVVVIGDGPGLPYEKLLANSPNSWPSTRLDPNALVSLNYSSGTTGRPKGAQRTHGNRLASLVNMTADVLGAIPTESDAYLHAGPITHTSGLFVVPFLAAGARQVILPRWDPEAVLDAVAHRGVTHTALVPTMIARLLALPECTREAMLGLRMLGYAGAPMPPEQIRQAYERITPNLVQYYGLVEAIPPVTVLDAADHAAGLDDQPGLLTSAGRPALGVEIRVVDEDGADVPEGEIGEVITRGAHVMRGYWQSGQRTDLGKTVRDGWLHTGDLGRVDGAERLWLVDRKGDMIISGGYNIYPREVEDVLAEVPGVHEVAVVGVADPEWGQRVVAAYSVHTGQDVDEAALLAHCRERLAPFKKPKELHRVEEFPLNSTGKIAKQVLRRTLAEREA